MLPSLNQASMYGSLSKGLVGMDGIVLKRDCLACLNLAGLIDFFESAIPFTAGVGP